MLLMPLPVLRILPGQLRAADDQQVLGVPGFGGLGEVDVPVLLLLTGAATAFFTGYLHSLFQPSREVSRLALSRIKLLVFACSMILAIHELLASDGLLRLPE